MNELTLNLPWPPSVNAVWRSVVRGKFATVYKTDQGKDYEKRVCKIHMLMGKPKLGDARLCVTVEVYPPDRRRRDLGNLDKVLMDSLEKAGVFDDDSQIDDLRFIRKAVEKPGRVIVNIQIMATQSGL